MDGSSPEFAFTSLHDAAIQLRGAARRAGEGLHLLPFSRYDPEHRTWWLSPVAENPAFAHGKIVIEQPSVVEDGAVIIGLHVEKGVGPSAAEAFQATAKGRHLILQRDWTWHPFVRGIRSGQVDRDLVAAESAADGMPLIFLIATSTAYPRDPDDDWHPLDVERVWYSASGGRLSRRGRDSGARLAGFEDRETMVTILDRLEATPDIDWTWIDLYIGVPFRPVPEGGQSPDEVWRKACEPWRQWVR